MIYLTWDTQSGSAEVMFHLWNIKTSIHPIRGTYTLPEPEHFTQRTPAVAVCVPKSSRSRTNESRCLTHSLTHSVDFQLSVKHSSTSACPKFRNTQVTAMNAASTKFSITYTVKYFHISPCNAVSVPSFLCSLDLFRWFRQTNERSSSLPHSLTACQPH